MPRVSRTTSVGSTRSMMGSGSSSINIRTRGASTTPGLSAVVMQNVVLRMMAVRLAWTEKHPEHCDETSERNDAGHSDDHDISPNRPDQMIMHGALHFICP